MNISFIGLAWSAVKGFFSFGTSAGIGVADYIITSVNDFCGNTSWIAANIAKAYTSLVWVCDKLDYYAKYIPNPWANIYSSIRNALGELRDTLADGRVEREEIERVAAKVREVCAAWNK